MKTIKEINRNKYYLKSNVKRDVEFREFGHGESLWRQGDAGVQLPIERKDIVESLIEISTGMLRPGRSVDLQAAHRLIIHEMAHHLELFIKKQDYIRKINIDNYLSFNPNLAKNN